MQLVEEGSLTLGARAGAFIPSFARTTVAVANERGGVTQVPARRADHHSRSPDAHGRHFIRHRAVGGGAVRSEGTGSRCRLRLVHRRQGRTGLRHHGAARHAAVCRAAWRGLGLRLQHRHPRLHRREGVGHAARCVHSRSHHRAARHEGHAVLSADAAQGIAWPRCMRSGADGKYVRAPDGSARAGRIRRWPAAEFRRRRRTAVDGARLRALPRGDATRRIDRRDAHPLAALREADVDAIRSARCIRPPASASDWASRPSIASAPTA